MLDKEYLIKIKDKHVVIMKEIRDNRVEDKIRVHEYEAKR